MQVLLTALASLVMKLMTGLMSHPQTLEEALLVVARKLLKAAPGSVSDELLTLAQKAVEGQDAAATPAPKA